MSINRTTAPALGPASLARFPHFERVPLGNGVEAFILPVAESELFAFQIYARGGAQLQKAGQDGLALMTASLLDEGTSHQTSTEIALRAESLGGYLASSINRDSFVLSTGSLTEHRGDLLALASEVLYDCTLPEEELERLRTLTMTELSQRMTQPGIVASDLLIEALYGEGTYGHPLVGSEEAVRGFSREDIEGFYRNTIRHAPKHILVAGGFEPQQIQAELKRHFGQTEQNQVNPLPDFKRLPAGSLRILVGDRPEAAQTELRVGRVGPTRYTEDYTVLGVMNSLLGGKFTSRLNLNLREENGYTYGAHSRFLWRQGPGPFIVSTAVDNENVGAATGEVFSEIERLVNEPVGEKELEETKSYLVGVFPYTLQTLDGLNSRLAQIAVYDLPIDEYAHYVERIMKTSKEDVFEAAQKHLGGEDWVVTAVGPAADLVPQLESLGPVTVVES